MDHLLVLFMLLWGSGFSPGFQIKENDAFKEAEDIRLVDGCSGELQVKRDGEWKGVNDRNWDLKLADVICRHLDCGSAVRISIVLPEDEFSPLEITPSCLQSEHGLKKCLTKRSTLSNANLMIICSDSVRLVNGTGLCSGRLEVKQSNQSWSSVCEDDFDQQDAEVVCRQLGCGAPSVLQGALYGEVEAPVWTKEFQCGGQESALLDCRSSDRNTCSSGKAVGLTCSEPQSLQLVGGSSRCAGEVETTPWGMWGNVVADGWNLKTADVVCRHLDCGSAVSTGWRMEGLYMLVRLIKSTCLQSKSAVRECILTTADTSLIHLEITCSDSVRLVNGTGLCSGRLEVKQSDQSWSSVCEDGFDQQDAEVVCRQLGCGAPSVFQGALYGEVEAPVWTKEFQCGGQESALLDCRSSDRNTCSSGKAVGLTCSEPQSFRLVGGSSRCSGELEAKQWGMWVQVDDDSWNLKTADVVCRHLDCGSAVSTGRRRSLRETFVWQIKSTCLQSKSAVRDCLLKNEDRSEYNLEITCSDSVRLVNGTGLCSGRLEVKQSDQSDQSWSSVCEDDFDQQDAEVVCRQLGCGAPSVLQGVLYGEVEAPVWTKEFQCGGQESALLDCEGSGSGSDRNTCFSGKAVRLTCSEPDDVRLVGGASPCVGRLEMKHKGDWRPAVDYHSYWNLMSAAVVCRQLDCGSALSTGRREDLDLSPVWIISSSCGQSETAIRECTSIYPLYGNAVLEVNCSDSVRLVNGTGLCSGRLEVKQSNQSWSSVCEDDFDQQDAEVVCRQLGCGAPSVLQGALYGEVEAPVWTKEFQCGGQESALLDCRSSDRNTCSSGKAVGLTCSEPDNVRLFGGTSRCDGMLQMKHLGEWRPVSSDLFQTDRWFRSAVCTRLNCGSAVEVKEGTYSIPVWWISNVCVRSDLILQECLNVAHHMGRTFTLNVVCSDFLAQPNISFSNHTDGVSEATMQGIQLLMGSNFTLSCSIEPQYEGGFFQLVSTTSNTAHNSTLPAVNHSAHFLFSAADHTHRGEYRCVYHVHVFSGNFSSESESLHLTVAASMTHLIIRVVVLLLIMIFSPVVLFFYCKATRGQKPKQENSMEPNYLGGVAEDVLGEEAGGAQGGE